MNNQFLDFVAAELRELETRDVDQLFDCLKDTLEEMGCVVENNTAAQLYNEIERQVEAEKRADKYAGGAE